MNSIQKSTPIFQVVEQLLDAGAVKEAIDTLRAGLQAARTYFDANARRMVEEPDFKTRALCAVKILEYTLGKPIERREIVTKNATTLEDLQKQSKSPEFRRALEDLLAENSGLKS